MLAIGSRSDVMVPEGGRSRYEIAHLHLHLARALPALVAVVLAVDENTSRFDLAYPVAVDLVRRGIVDQGRSA